MMFRRNLNHGRAAWLLAGGLSLLSWLASAGTTIVLAWDPSPDSTVAGYRLHVGTSPGIYTESINLGLATQATTPELDWDTDYFFAVTAYNGSMRESDFSNPISYRTPQQPLPPVEPPAIYQEPPGQLVVQGEETSLNAAWTGGEPMICQWYKGETPLNNGSHYSGVNSSTLNIVNADEECAGLYTVILSNPSGSTRSIPAYVHVLSEPRIDNVAAVGNGTSRISIGNADGSPLIPSQVYRLTVLASTNPTPKSAWLPLTNGMTLSNGVVSLEETRILNYPQRYYRTIMTGSSIGPLKVETPQRLEDGSMRIGISRADGIRSITPAEAELVAIQVTTDPSGAAGWKGLRGDVHYSSTRLTLDDVAAANFTQQFYRSVIRKDDPPRLRLRMPALTPHGSLQLAVGRADGSPMSNRDVFNYEVFVNTNLLESSRWTLLTHTMAYANGVLTIDDTNAASTPLRTYRVFAK